MRSSNFSESPCVKCEIIKLDEKDQTSNRVYRRCKYRDVCSKLEAFQRQLVSVDSQASHLTKGIDSHSEVLSVGYKKRG